MRQAENAPAPNLPHDKEAEQSVLGAILHDNENLLKAAALLRPESFFSPGNRDIFSAMEELALRRDPVDEITVANLLRAKGQLGNVGGLAYLAELQDVTPVSSNVNAYAEIVQDKATARNMIELLTRKADQLRMTGIVGEVLGEMRSEIQRIMGASTPIASKTAGEMLAPIADRLEGRVEPASLARWYVPALDKAAGPLSHDRPTVVTAPTGHGKSLLLDQVAMANAVNGLPVLKFNLEDSEEEVAVRRITARTSIDARTLLFAKPQDTEGWSELMWDKLSVAFNELHNLKTLHTICPDDQLTLTQIEHVCRWHYERHKIGLIVVDHLSWIKQPGEQFDAQTERIKGLKLIGRALRVPVLVACHENDEGRTKGSREIENNASCLIQIRDPNPADQHTHMIEAHIPKSAHGPRGKVSLWFHGWRFAIDSGEQNDERSHA